jgi:hypothetical protein
MCSNPSLGKDKMKIGQQQFAHFLRKASVRFLTICYFISNFQQACSNPTSELKAQASPIVAGRITSIKAVNILNFYHM